MEERKRREVEGGVEKKVAGAEVSRGWMALRELARMLWRLATSASRGAFLSWLERMCWRWVRRWVRARLW